MVTNIDLDNSPELLCTTIRPTRVTEILATFIYIIVLITDNFIKISKKYYGLFTLIIKSKSPLLVINDENKFKK